MRNIFCRVDWTHCKPEHQASNSSFLGTVSVSVAGLLLSHMDRLSIWPYSGKGPREAEGTHSYLNPPHTTKALLHGLSSPLPSSSYTYLTISKMGITNSHHLNCYSRVREITADSDFFFCTGGYQNATPFATKLLLFHVPLSHSGFVSSLCNLLSRGENVYISCACSQQFLRLKAQTSAQRTGAPRDQHGSGKTSAGICRKQWNGINVVGVWFRKSLVVTYFGK